MSLARFVAFAGLALSCIASAGRVATAYVLERVDRGIAFVLDTLAYARAPRVVSGGYAPATGPSFYDAPPVHSLRHEAGVSRRAADRHT